MVHHLSVCIGLLGILSTKAFVTSTTTPAGLIANLPIVNRGGGGAVLRNTHSQRPNRRLLSVHTMTSEIESDSTNGIARNRNNTDDNTANLGFPEEALLYDSYNGVTLDVSQLSSSNFYHHDDGRSDRNTDLFRITIETSLKNWKDDGLRGIWVNLPTDYACLVPVCTDLGFDFQYAKKGLLVLTKWLPQDVESRLPYGPSYQVGIGALILHPVTGKMLVVQEKSGPASVHKLWKMPTGLTDPNEDLPIAAIREVREETGLAVTFDRVVCIRQAHGVGALSHSDLFFVCHLVLDSNKYHCKQTIHGDEKGDGDGGWEIPLVPQEEEIEEISWMGIDEYSQQNLWMNSPLYQEMNSAMQRMKDEFCANGRGVAITNGSGGDNHKSIDNNCDNGMSNGRSLYEGMVCKTLPLGYRDGTASIYVSKS